MSLILRDRYVLLQSVPPEHKEKDWLAAGTEVKVPVDY
jgi:hypothetical protein